MPMMLPMLPPMIAIMNKVDSGILQRRFFARYLSSPIRNKPIRFTAVKYATSKVITFIRMTIPFLLLSGTGKKCGLLGGLFLRFLHLHGADLAGEAEKVDKAFRVVVVVQIAGGEGSNAFII